MDSRDKQAGWTRFLKGFACAFSGLIHSLVTERNMKVHFAAGIAVMVLAFIFHLTYTEKLILLVVIGVVISLELVNTAIEHTVNLVTDENHPLAKLAKDAAAAAVLFFSMIAVIIAIAVFFHHFHP